MLRSVDGAWNGDVGAGLDEKPAGVSITYSLA